MGNVFLLPAPFNLNYFIKDQMIINGISRMDLMGGKKSLFNGFVNVDKIAEEGIKTQIEYLDKVITNNINKKLWLIILMALMA